MNINKLTSPATSKGVEVARAVNKLIDSVGFNRVIVRSANDFPDEIDSTVEYFIDGVIDMGYRQIKVPAGGMTLTGYSFDLSKLVTSEPDYTMFISPAGGSGNLLGKDYAITVNGANSKVYNLTSVTGFEAFEFQRINYDDCTSLGSITNYRQGLESGTGRFGGSPTLELVGAWNGFRVDTSIARGMVDGVILFKAGAGLEFSGRFVTNINVDLPAIGSLSDFSDVNITGDESLIIQGAFITRQGVLNSKDSNILPNIAASSVKSNWQSNTGLPNTNKYIKASCTAEIATPIPATLEYYPLLGTFAVNQQVHFDMPANGEFRLLTGSGDYLISGDLVISGTANTIAVGIKQARKLSALVAGNYSSQRLAEWTADEGSLLRLPSDLPLVGNVNQIVVDTNLADDELMIFDSGMISVVPMAANNATDSGAWRTKDATQNGQDGERTRIIGDFAMEVRQSKTHMARLHNISVA